MKKLSVTDFLSIKDLCFEDIGLVFKLAEKIKNHKKTGKGYNPLKGKTLGMIFKKASTRTRVSFEAGMYELGGHALFLSTDDIQLGRGEEIKDTARVLSRFIDGIMIRTFDHNDVIELAEYSTIPVINGLSDLLHPCQVMSDIFTIIEKKGSRIKNMKVAFVGDGNNVANSWAYAAAKLGFKLSIASPEGYWIDKGIIEQVKVHIDKGIIELTDDPKKAVSDADVVYTDVWTSMGQESEQEKRKKIFRDFQVNSKLLKQAKSDAIVMHCLPAHREEEITADVIEGKQSVIFDQAENRLHVQKAILVLLLG